MHVCEKCGLAMRRVLGPEGIYFRCACGETVPGGPEDARLSGAVLHAGETAGRYDKLIRNSAFDRTAQQVKKDCPRCGLDYMTQVRVGENEFIVYTCKCGYSSASAADIDAALGTAGELAPTSST